MSIRGDYPLHCATEVGNVNLINLLLSNGADVNAKNGSDETALHTACLFADPKMIGILLRKGADISTENIELETPFSFLVMGYENISDGAPLIEMLKGFSRLSFDKIPICQSDMNMIQADSRLRKHFEECKEEVNKMNNTIFYSSYSYYSVIKMSKNIRKLSKLTNNDKFVSEFEKNASSFEYHRNDLNWILEEAIQVRDDTKIVRSKLNGVIGDHFPDLVIRKLADYLTTDDLPQQ